MHGPLFTKHTQKAREWVNQINDSLQFQSQAHALDALRAVLHQLRDNLPINEAVNLGAQLPLVIRGVFFEGWRPPQVPLKERHKKDFIVSVKNNLEHYINKSFYEDETERIIIIVLKTLSCHIDEDEMIKVGRILPPELRGFIINAYNR